MSELDLANSRQPRASSAHDDDARFMYFAPIAYGKVTLTARFDTKSATVMPELPQFHGSFF